MNSEITQVSLLFSQELHTLEVETFEIEDIVEIGQVAGACCSTSSTSTCSSCTSSSSTSCSTTSTGSCTSTSNAINIRLPGKA